jgi:hypothetical protein
MARKANRRRVAREPRSKADVSELKAHSKAKTPVSKISKAMKRTATAVRQKARAIGLGIGHKR